MRYALANGLVYTADAELSGHAVLIQDSAIEAVLPTSDLPADVPKHDVQGLRVAPGLIDLQVYGGGGVLFSTHPTAATLAHLEQTLRQQGTTHFLATMPTNSPALMREALVAGRAHQRQNHGTGLLGVHLEGPYLNPEKKGAHQQEFIKRPDLAELQEWLRVADGALRIMTMAPEMATSEAVALLRTAGVVLSAGHSNATYEQATAALASDFTAATHLFNAMSPLTGRAPGVVGAVYGAATAQASIIADGIHCDFASVRISKKIMGERLFLITDAVEESPEGAYRFRRRNDHFVDEQGTLGGSALTMLQAVRNCVEQVGVPLAEALRMATLYPARVLGLDAKLGRIAPGYEAALCLFDEAWRVRGTVHGGELRWYAAEVIQ